MKVLIISDSHGRHENVDKVLRKEKHLDMLIHLGDIEGDEDYIQASAGCPLYAVRGNNDFFSNLDYEMTIAVGKYDVFITHGHMYYASLGIEELLKEGRARNKDVVMFGHTHVPMLQQYEDITILNPGSISYPRQEGRIPTYAIMELDDKGEAHYRICELKD